MRLFGTRRVSSGAFPSSRVHHCGAAGKPSVGFYTQPRRDAIGIHLSDTVEVRNTAPTDGALARGLGLVAATDIDACELVAVIPHHATIQAPSTLPAVLTRTNDCITSLVTSSSHLEQGWWRLGVVVALKAFAGPKVLNGVTVAVESSAAQSLVSVASSSDGVLSYLSDGLPRHHPLELASVLQNYEYYCSKQGGAKQSSAVLIEKMLKYKLEIKRLHAALRADWVECREAIRSPGGVVDAESLCSEEQLLWAMAMVRSRANNFSFVGCTEMLRPYGVVDTPPDGALPTMCPYFDAMNHVWDTNVIVADRVCTVPNHEKKQLEQIPCLTISTFLPVPRGHELGYRYNGGDLRNEDAVVQSLLRWGFVPSA